MLGTNVSGRYHRAPVEDLPSTASRVAAVFGSGLSASCLESTTLAVTAAQRDRDLEYLEESLHMLRSMFDIGLALNLAVGLKYTKDKNSPPGTLARLPRPDQLAAFSLCNLRSRGGLPVLWPASRQGQRHQWLGSVLQDDHPQHPEP